MTGSATAVRDVLRVDQAEAGEFRSSSFIPDCLICGGKVSANAASATLSEHEIALHTGITDGGLSVSDEYRQIIPIGKGGELLRASGPTWI